MSGSGSGSVFDLFQSKENVQIIREHIAQTIESDYQQKIGFRYDGLIEAKMKELISQVPEKVPEGKTKKEYLLMMNKKLISMVLPTVKANAIKERGRGPGGTGGNTGNKSPRPMIEDPQDLLRGPGAREQFNLPLEDMSGRMIPDHPRPNGSGGGGGGGGGGPGDRMLSRMENERNIYNQFQNGPPTTMPKFKEEIPEKRPAETLALYNQLVSKYQEEKVKAGEVPEEMEIKSNSGRQERSVDSSADVVDSQNPFQRKKIFLRKTKQDPMSQSDMATPIDQLDRLPQVSGREGESGEGGIDKVKELLTYPTGMGMAPVPYPLPVRETGRSSYIHLSSNYRNFEYQKSPSSIRLYLSSNFLNVEDPYAFFQLPDYVDKFGNTIYNAFQYAWDMKHHIHIPFLKKLKGIELVSVKVMDCGFVQENPKIYAELLPRKRGDRGRGEDVEGSGSEILPFYHNQSHRKRTLLTYSGKEEIYQPIRDAGAGGREDPYIDIKEVIQQGYLQVNLYDLYQDYIHYERDHRIVKEIVLKEDDPEHIYLYLANKEVEIETEVDMEMIGKRIYLYSMLPDPDQRYVEMTENVLVESIDKIMDREEDGMTLFKLMALNTEDEKNHYRIHFREMFQHALHHLEDDQHKEISELFYFVVQQQVGNRQVCYYCNIEYIDELGHAVLSHREGNAIVENYMNTEQFGFVKKNFHGSQSEDRSSLFRKSGFVVKAIEEMKEKILCYTIQKPSADFVLPVNRECFLIHQPYEIDVVLKAHFA